MEALGVSCAAVPSRRARSSRSNIVGCHADAVAAQAKLRVQHLRRSDPQHPLHDLELEGRGRQAGLLQCVHDVARETLVGRFGRRNVRVEPDMFAGMAIEPGAQQRQGAAQHPSPDHAREPALLGERDEAVGCDGSVARECFRSAIFGTGRLPPDRARATPGASFENRANTRRSRQTYRSKNEKRCLPPASARRPASRGPAPRAAARARGQDAVHHRTPVECAHRVEGGEVERHPGDSGRRDRRRQRRTASMSAISGNRTSAGT